MQLNVTLEIPETHLCDLLTTAWEGGSDHWTPAYDARSVRRKEPVEGEILRELDVIRIVYQTPDGNDEFNEPVQTNEVGPEQIAAAIGAVMNGAVEVGDHIRKDIENNINEVGACDADTADVLLQVATFGSIIYG
jgi:hypothetical protein